MFQPDESIHILHGSNTADTWMIPAALLTLASSLVLGVAAWQNGRTATQISKKSVEISLEAARQEERRLESERINAVAVAMLQALNALDTRLSLSPSSPQFEEALFLERRLILEARALTAVYPYGGRGNQLTPLFTHSHETLASTASIAGVGTPRYLELFRTTEDSIAMRNAGQIGVQQLWDATSDTMARGEILDVRQ